MAAVGGGLPSSSSSFRASSRGRSTALSGDLFVPIPTMASSAGVRDEGSGNPCLRSGEDDVLRRLRYSNLRVGLCHRADVSATKAMKNLSLVIIGYVMKPSREEDFAKIQEDSGDHVIVDVNYLPSFKEVPNGDAIPAFWTAIKSAYESRKAN